MTYSLAIMISTLWQIILAFIEVLFQYSIGFYPYLWLNTSR